MGPLEAGMRLSLAGRGAGLGEAWMRLAPLLLAIAGTACEELRDLAL